MNITTSPDISLLQIKVTWDISGTVPVIRLLNQSAGSDLAAISWAFTAKSPSGTFIHTGNINQPDVTGIWTDYLITDTWPKPFNQIEFSGAPYIFYITIKDSIGNVITTEATPQPAFICRPVGNTQKSKNPFGLASSDIKVQCNIGRVFFQDNTYHSYRGEDGTLISSTLKVMYPIDETGTIPDPFAISSYSTALVPISYSSPNYQFLQNEVYDYEFADDTVIRIKYQLLRTFAVWCNIDLMALQCEVSKLSDEIINGNCSDVAEAQNKLNAIVPKFMLVVMGTLQPLLGVDVPKLIEEIEAIGGFNCNCCSVPTGIIPTTAAIIDGYSFSVNKLGGDVNGNFSTNGSNITLNIGDVSYVVRMGLDSPSSFSADAIYFTEATSEFQTIYYLNIDGINFQRELLVNIGNDPYSLNYLNSLITKNTGNWTLTVDGGCVIDTTSACDYVFTLSNIPANTTYALLSSILYTSNNINEVNALDYQFNLTNLSGLQSYMNGIGFGTFVVTNLGGGNVSITTTSNPNTLSNLTYTVSATQYVADMTKNCTGSVPVSANQVVQSIINYLCGIDDSQVITSQPYVISFINPDTGIVEEQTVVQGSNVNDFIAEFLDANVNTINYILSISKLDCANVQGLFPPSIFTMQANDFILGTKGGGLCNRIYPVEFGTRLLQLGLFDTQFMQAFCNAVNFCANGQTCSPFASFSVSTIQHSPTDDLQDILVTFSNSGSGIASYDIKYARIDNTNTPVYFTVNTASSPYTITNVDEGQYNVQITPVYSDGRQCSFMSLNTGACEGITAFNAVNGSGNTTIPITYTATSPKVKLIVSYPNGGGFSAVYPNTGTITFNVPASTYGVYSLTLSPVCNETTEWIGVPTAPVLINIPNPPNSVIINYEAYAFTSVFMSLDGGLNFNFGTLALSGGSNTFYVPDGFYGTITLSWATGAAPLTATLVTGIPGTYNATIGTTSLTFSNVVAQDGIDIAISAP